MSSEKPKGYDIKPIRKVIHDKLVEKVFKDRGGGNFTSLEGYDIEAAFDLYDEHVFGGQIRKKLHNEGSILRFFAKARTSGVGGMCGIRTPTLKPRIGETGIEFSEICEYYINIAPNILIRIIRVHADRLKLIAGVGCSDRVYCLQLVLEHEIMHLLMILWGYIDKEVIGINAHIYTKHGKLYQCILYAYFGHTEYSHDLGLSEIDILERSPYRTPTFPKSLVKPGLMKNWSGSCYMDSLITVLFIADTTFYRRNIFDIKPQEIDYLQWSESDLGKLPFERGKKIFKKICRPGSLVRTESETKAYAARLQTALREDYERVIERKELFKCTNLRNVFAECMPDLKPFGDYNVSELYDVLTDIFPQLKLRHIPATIVNPILKITYDGEIETKTMFQMWDYMDPGTETEGATPKWREVNSPVLVFQNGLIPPIRNYGSTKPESIIVYGPIPGRYTYVYRTIEGQWKKIAVPKLGPRRIIQRKARAFGEYIIDKRYRLFGIVVVQGPRPHSLAEWGGGHYVSYVRPKGDSERWYHYNDLGPIWSLASKDGSLPSDIFIDRPNKRPELFFYEKIKDTPGKKLPEKETTPSPKSIERVVEWQGEFLHTKMMYRSNGNVMLFARDDSPGLDFVRKIMELKPRYTTKVTEETYMWREIPDVAKKLLAEIQEIDRTAARSPYKVSGKVS